jgi:hypothetical protein
MDWREKKGSMGDVAEASASLDENRLEGRRVKVRCDRSPVEGMMTEPLRSFCGIIPRQR